MSTVVCWFKRTLKQLEREQTDRQTDRKTDRQTDTHDDYRNPLAHARRGLITIGLIITDVDVEALYLSTGVRNITSPQS